MADGPAPFLPDALFRDAAPPDEVDPMTSIFDTIARLKAEWTDKYVVVSSSAPELARFATTTGVVKTVNMNGRCLVEFDQYNNIGWYDIDPSALRIVTEPLPKPAPKPAAKPAAAKPAAAKPAAAKAAAAKPAAAKTAAAKPAGTARPSTADILAMARGAKAAAAKPAAPAAEPEPTPEPAAETPAEPAPAATVRTAPAAKPSGPLPTSTAEKIAWCRAHDAKG